MEIEAAWPPCHDYIPHLYRQGWDVCDVCTSPPPPLSSYQSSPASHAHIKDILFFFFVVVVCSSFFPLNASFYCHHHQQQQQQQAVSELKRESADQQRQQQQQQQPRSCVLHNIKGVELRERRNAAAAASRSIVVHCCCCCCSPFVNKRQDALFLLIPFLLFGFFTLCDSSLCRLLQWGTHSIWPLDTGAIAAGAGAGAVKDRGRAFSFITKSLLARRIYDSSIHHTQAHTQPSVLFCSALLCTTKGGGGGRKEGTKKNEIKKANKKDW